MVVYAIVLCHHGNRIDHPGSILSRFIFAKSKCTFQIGNTQQHVTNPPRLRSSNVPLHLSNITDCDTDPPLDLQ